MFVSASNRAMRSTRQRCISSIGVRPNSRTARINYRDADTSQGRSYYYVRVFQRDPEKPNGDPEIAWASPFYVTYK